jgi:hypothetical protein
MAKLRMDQKKDEPPVEAISVAGRDVIVNSS